jgi:hypothetical protein
MSAERKIEFSVTCQAEKKDFLINKLNREKETKTIKTKKPNQIGVF